MVGALAFLPGKDGFGFENYGGDSRAVNLTPAEMVRLFGAGVCASGTGEDCVLTPAAQSWMDETNQSMGGWHCEGMAVLSLFLHKGLADPANFGSVQTTYDLPFAENVALQREIAYWFAQQGVSPTQPAERKDLTPVEVMRALLDSFKPGAGEAYTLGIYRWGYQAGHAITRGASPRVRGACATCRSMTTTILGRSAGSRSTPPPTRGPKWPQRIPTSLTAPMKATPRPAR
jgi:hypothetical protein